LGSPTVGFTAISWVYLLGAGLTVYRLSQNWRQFWDDSLTPLDRQLAAGVAFFLLVPLGVLLHEFGHMLAAWSTSSQVLGLHYFLYWGYVEIVPAANSPLLDWYIALAGNFVSYLLGLACVLVALKARGLKLVLRVTLMQLGLLELLQTLVAYPLMSLDPSFVGDWDTIYSFGAPVASTATAIWHTVSLVGFIVFLRRSRTANWLLRGY
jgi:hypothetical protein